MDTCHSHWIEEEQIRCFRFQPWKALWDLSANFETILQFLAKLSAQDLKGIAWSLQSLVRWDGFLWSKWSQRPDKSQGVLVQAPRKSWSQRSCINDFVWLCKVLKSIFPPVVEMNSHVFVVCSELHSCIVSPRKKNDVWEEVKQGLVQVCFLLLAPELSWKPGIPGVFRSIDDSLVSRCEVKVHGTKNDSLIAWNMWEKDANRFWWTSNTAFDVFSEHPKTNLNLTVVPLAKPWRGMSALGVAEWLPRRFWKDKDNIN